MTTKMIIYVCDSAVDAQAAHDFLIGSGYPAATIETDGPLSTVTYDAETYKSRSGTSDEQENVWVVIGRK